jgi:hypothetical protein
VSSVPANPSQRNVPPSSATLAEPATTPKVATMPSVSTRLLSLNSSSHSSV